MLVITRIPTHRNDGEKISTKERREILQQVRTAFGGYTLEGPFQGAWVADDGKVYEETSYRLEVIIEPAQLQVARELVIRIGKQLGSGQCTSKSAKAARLLILHKSTVALGVCAGATAAKGPCHEKAEHEKQGTGVIEVRSQSSGLGPDLGGSEQRHLRARWSICTAVSH